MKKIYETKADQNKAAQARFRARHPQKYYEVNRNKHLKQTFGITLADYRAMFEKQGGNCAICGTHQSFLSRSLAVDHDHKTGKLRQLLCTNCNMILGGSKESETILQACVDYIKKHDAR